MSDKVNAVIAEMYEDGASLMAISGEVDKPKSTVHTIIQKLISAGVVEHRGRVTVKKEAKEAREVSPPVLPEPPAKKEACKCVAVEVNDDITEFVKGLLLGANKVVVYRKGATVTVDFAGG